jgi:hypothetical protein
MNNYETLVQCLDALEAIKEKAANQTQVITPEEVKKHFAQAAARLEKYSVGWAEVLRGQPMLSRLRLWASEYLGPPYVFFGPPGHGPSGWLTGKPTHYVSLCSPQMPR